MALACFVAQKLVPTQLFIAFEKLSFEDFFQAIKNKFEHSNSINFPPFLIMHYNNQLR